MKTEESPPDGRSRAVVRLKGVTKEYQAGARPVRVVDDVSLDILDGEFILVLGPSGSGKTTLLNLVSALMKPTNGRIWIGGSEITALTDAEATRFRAENIGLVFQFFNLFPALTALENVEIGVALKLRAQSEVRTRSLRYLEMVGLGEMADKFPSQLSGGEQQRVAVARALAMEPRILLADEPTGNLDAETGETMWRLLKDLNRRTGTTVVAVTHWSEASAMADRTVRLRSGRIESIVGSGKCGARPAVVPGAAEA